MKIQLWMRGHEGDSKARVYKTITEQEFVDILAVVLPNDGTRPWETGDPADQQEQVA